VSFVVKRFFEIFVEQQQQEQQEQLPQRTNSSPEWYRNIAIIFFTIAAILAWAALLKHDWTYGAFAIITSLNAIMTTLKFITVRETGR
jgi:hypothetical protein